MNDIIEIVELTLYLKAYHRKKGKYSFTLAECFDSAKENHKLLMDILDRQEITEMIYN